MFTGGPYKQIAARLPTGFCVKCKNTFHEGDRYRVLFIAVAVDTHFSGAGRALYVSRYVEYAHIQCESPCGLPTPHTGRRPNKLDATHPDMLPIQEPRTPSYICNQCRKEIRPGDRVIQVLISAGTCKDPESQHPNMVASPNFESAHESCADPQLNMTGGLILTS